jgi:hypothetical protein
MAPPKASRPATELVNEPRAIDLPGGTIGREAKAKSAWPQAVHFRSSDRAPPINAAHARRQMAARQYVPDEPRRPRAADIEQMVSQLPYGQWTAGDGRVVIFNRRYTPIWERLPDGTVQRANPHEWVRWIEQSWFDCGSARYEKNARERYRKVLQDFFDGKELVAKDEVL